jgi:GNAT superfamily N-acetyltransferase
MEFELKAIDDPDDELREAVYVHLRTHNQSSNPVGWQARERPENAPRPISLFAYDENGDVIAGLFASTEFAWLKVDIMATAQAHRGKGIGRALLEKAEAIAVQRGCRYAFVDTMDYQAPTFYQAAGYQIAGQIDDWDSHGHSKFFFTKPLR